MSRLEVAVVGTGKKGNQHLGILHDHENVKLVAVCDPLPAARDQAGEEFGIEARYDSVESMLEKEADRLDAVWVATPPDLNAPTALPCLQQGVNTFLEKPPGMGTAETKALRDAAEQTGAKGMVGWNRRMNSFVVKARQMVEERGPIVQLVGEFHKSLTAFEKRGNYSDEFLDNMMWESINHSVDVVRALANSDVVEVHSVVRRALHKYKDVFGAMVVFENNCLAHLIFNWTTDGRLERYELHGRDISAYLEGIETGYVVRDGQRIDIEPGGGGTEEQDAYFLDCIANDRPVTPPACNLDEAVKTVELCDAILAGLRED
jgi:predicted dehydrogenase